MKIIYIVLLLCLCGQAATGQKLAFLKKMEYTVGVTGGTSYFRGANAVATTTIIQSDAPGAIPNYANDSYGNKPGLALGGEVAAQYLIHRHFIVGVGAGYDWLTTRTSVNRVASRTSVAANGSMKQRYGFVTFFPYIGQRIGNKLCAFDINLGLDVALPVSAQEEGEASINNIDGPITVDRSLPKPNVDLRPRLQVKWQESHFGISLSYSLGLTNYYDRWLGSELEAYSNVAKAGVFYRF
jgi:hypothetical protein